MNLDDVLDRMIAEHTADADAVIAARRDYEDRRGRVFQEEELWERWSAAFVEWYVVERVEPRTGDDLPPAAASLRAARAAGDDVTARAVRAWLTSHRSLFEIRALSSGRVELLDLLGGAQIAVAEPRDLLGVSAGDVAELRVLGFDGEVRFGRTFVFHPRGARDAILAHARRLVAAGGDRRAVIDHCAALRVKVERYRHMSAARVYELPTAGGLVRGLVVLAILCAAAGTAAAQTPVGDQPAFSVERFTPPPGRGGFGVVDDPDVLPAWRWAAALWTSAMARPIVLRDLVTGDEATVPVRWRIGAEAHAAIGLPPRYQLGVAIPWAGQGGDRLRGTGLDEARLDRLVLGDVRLHGKARLAGRPGAPGVTAALGIAVILPTGDEQHFAGEAATAVAWHLAVGWRGERGALAGNLGARLRGEEVVLLSPARPHGDELSIGLAGSLALGRRAAALAEVTKVVGDAIDAGARGPSPAEARAGLRIGIDEWAVTALGGAGLSPGDIGSPAWRLVLGVVHDRAPISDRDGDGVRDGLDRCRASAEDVDGHDDGDGCPDPDDDGDGMFDDVDACPREAEDVDDFRDADGCPDDEVYLPPLPPEWRMRPLPEWLRGEM